MRPAPLTPLALSTLLSLRLTALAVLLPQAASTVLALGASLAPLRSTLPALLLLLALLALSFLPTVLGPANRFPAVSSLLLPAVLPFLLAALTLAVLLLLTALVLPVLLLPAPPAASPLAPATLLLLADLATASASLLLGLPAVLVAAVSAHRLFPVFERILATLTVTLLATPYALTLLFLAASLARAAPLAGLFSPAPFRPAALSVS